MLVEIPDPEIILGIVVSFFVGLFALYIFYKIKPSTNTHERYDPSSFDRLEYYERQLIDMKIRLDSLEISGEGSRSPGIKDFALQERVMLKNMSIILNQNQNMPLKNHVR